MVSIAIVAMGIIMLRVRYGYEDGNRHDYGHRLGLGLGLGP